MPKVLCTKELASFVPKFDGVVLWNSLGSDRLIPWAEPEPVVDADGVPGLKVADVFPGSAAEKAGLHAGDVIHSINGYLTAKRDDLAWIMANAAPDGVVKVSVRTASDGKVLRSLPSWLSSRARRRGLPPCRLWAMVHP